MTRSPRVLLAFCAATALLLAWPVLASAHAAFVRSDPPPGATLPAPPSAIRIWFAEPLETRFTRALLLNSTGEPVAGASSAIAPDNQHQLIVAVPADLVDGAYTVAWRTLSAADGHTLEGYFGFRIGEGAGAGSVPQSSSSAAPDALRTFTRGLALIGLAALLAIAPVTLAVLDAVARSVSRVGERLAESLRRFAVAAAAIALLGSLAALMAQALAIAPDEPLAAAIAQTLAETRYGQLWLWRLLGLLLVTSAVAVAFWGPQTWRRSGLLAATLFGLVAPIPFSLLSHASAQPIGTAAAVAADALHLLAAAIWGGGVLLLATALIPALRSLPPISWRQALATAIPRFSALAVAAWGVLVLSGLYSAWLQVGSIAALTETAYGQSLLLKGVLLAAVLVLAAYHFLLGWQGEASVSSRRVALTLGAEALLVIVVLLVVGRLIGQEPAREVMAGRTPGELAASITFQADDGARGGRLTVSPGAVGVNTFSLAVDGPALPDGSEGVLRFDLPERAMGVQELLLPAVGANLFQAEGPELSVSGEWRITVIVRQIGSFSWQTGTTLLVDTSPPPSPEVNPAPHFAAVGAAGMVLLAIGITGLAASLLSHWAPIKRRIGVGAAGSAATAIGIAFLVSALLPAGEPEAAPEGIVATPMATPQATAPAHTHVEPGTPIAAGPGTPVSGDGLTATLLADELRPGGVDFTLDLVASDGDALGGARVVAFSEMSGMSGKGQTVAEEDGPGRYRLRGVPLTMSGEWHITVRVAPKGQPSHVFFFIVPVP